MRQENLLKYTQKRGRSRELTGWRALGRHTQLITDGYAMDKRFGPKDIRTIERQLATKRTKKLKITLPKVGG